MKKAKHYTRNINIRLSEADYQLIVKTRKESKVPTSIMIRNSVQFYATFYNTSIEKL
ncbi:MAG: hypothetical protein WCI92_16810 [Bacteroidota bacterium]